MKKPRFAPRPALLKQIVDRSNYSNPSALENPDGFEQILAHRIGCQRAVPPCPAERHYQSPSSMSKSWLVVNSVSRPFSAFSTGFRNSRMAYIYLPTVPETMTRTGRVSFESAAARMSERGAESFSRALYFEPATAAAHESARIRAPR